MFVLPELLDVPRLLIEHAACLLAVQGLLPHPLSQKQCVAAPGFWQCLCGKNLLSARLGLAGAWNTGTHANTHQHKHHLKRKHTRRREPPTSISQPKSQRPPKAHTHTHTHTHAHPMRTDQVLYLKVWLAFERPLALIKRWPSRCPCPTPFRHLWLSLQILGQTVPETLGRHP